MVKQAKGKQAKDVQGYTAGSFYVQLVNCAGLCLFGAMTGPLPVVEYLNAVTGWDLSADEYLRTGERILSLRKAFNVREGIRPEDQKVHDRAMGRPPLRKGPLKGVKVDMDVLQKEFFKTVGWDSVTGGPTPEKLRELGIDTVIR
jgi:aldehyde:ferredoxin oxidoreductase